MIKKLTLWILQKIFKRYKVVCVSGFTQYDIKDLYFFKDEITIVMTNKRKQDIRLGGKSNGKGCNIRY